MLKWQYELILYKDLPFHVFFILIIHTKSQQLSILLFKLLLGHIIYFVSFDHYLISSTIIHLKNHFLW